ncbi:hypothetical protein LOC67_12975 [Stieleria sp. JC731]|uniref:phenylacetate--CoA ligase family protein n=1 Tax=Pirellulaceae TaxID=2691357 RepID=UPI001E4FA503|nr:hypothetical protein [Stieleria sp. JC731]MCC9601462.1 hypothetical protein [Stieleria sp. JC731]
MSYFLKSLVSRPLLRASCRFSRSNCFQLAHADSGDAVVERRLASLLNHARQHVPFYADRLRGLRAPLAPDSPLGLDSLREIPLLQKSDVEAHFPEGITDGTDPGDWRMMSTRGTAQRLILIQGFGKRDAVRAANLRMLERSGDYGPGYPIVEIPPEVCEEVCGELGEIETGVTSRLWQMIRGGKLRDGKSIRDLRGQVERHWIYNRKTYSGFGLHGSNPPGDVLQSYVDRLRKDRPYVLKALATYLIAIARYVESTGQDPLQIPVIKTSGSRIAPCWIPEIERALGGTFWNDYGSAEFGSIACDCKEHDGMHVFDDFFIVEVVNDDGIPLGDNQIGNVVVTDLMNHTMPMIRYKIGDLGRLDTSPCVCGQASPRLTVLGRESDVIRDGAGKVRLADQVIERIEQIDGVLAAQVQQKGDAWYALSIVAGKGTADGGTGSEHRSSEHTSVDRDQVAAEFKNWIGSDARVDVRTVRTLRPESGGKFRYVKSRLN